MFYANGNYKGSELETLTKEEWFKLPLKTRSDIRLALNQSIVYAKGEEKTRLFKIQSKLIGFSMGEK